MIAFARRRLLGTALLLIFSVLFLTIYYSMVSNLNDPSLLSGFLLLGMVAFLIGLNLRKRFSFFPIGRASTWLQVHIYVGWGSMVVFFAHTGFRSPTGPLETTLSFLFIVVALSGVIGLILSRIIPRRLTSHGGNITYEQIPKLKRLLKIEAETLAVSSVQETKKSTIADFYVERIEVFLMGSRRFLMNHFFGSKKHLNPLLTRMEAMHRYLNEQEIEIMNKLRDVVLRQDELDYQQSLLSILKCWLFVHIPLSYSLLIFGVFHGALAYRFVGG